MATYRFDKFVFDTESYELRVNGVLLAMRPKTAVLMAVLLTQRHQLLGKQTLFSEVWHSDHVQHQSLFQAISEIRKTLAPLQAIKTHPNLGYQWVTPVKQIAERRWLGRAVGGVLSLALVGGILISHEQTSKQVGQNPPQLTNTQSMLQSPAMRAFSNGIEQLNNQQLSEAHDSFELAERENPLFLEASMMKAEIMFEQANYSAAKALASDLLLRAVTRDEKYIEVSAQGLLSRISEKSGQLDSAMDWALKADSNARDQGFACVAENTRIRISGLLSETDLPANKAWKLDETSEIDPSLTDDKGLANDYPEASHCEMLREPSQPDTTKPDLSQCLDINAEYQSLAGNKPQFLSNHRWA